MLAKINSGCLAGIEAYPVIVEVDVTSTSLPSFSIIGLPDTSIKESRARIRSAIKNSGYIFPAKRITVNLSPAGIKKEGSGFDLPIAIGLLVALGALDQEDVDGIVFCGELSLNGKLRPFRGALPLAISLKNDFRSFLLPEQNALEASNIKGLIIHGARSLKQTIDHLKNIDLIPKTKTISQSGCMSTGSRHKNDFSDVKGQEHVKRGLEVAASGNHNILMIGPPGSGKSMLAKRFPSLLSDLSDSESLEVSKIYSIAGELHGTGLKRTRPFRSPHHTISYAAMSGGGSWPSPGEISLSHNGVLFLDEFPEFKRNVIETLRQPIESGEITISRVERSVKFPSRFLLIGAMNPCPCGNFTDPNNECRCSPNQIQKYLSKISGPLLDRIDIHLEVPRLNYDQLSEKRKGEPTATIKERVLKTQAFQKNRFKNKASHISYNAHMSSKETETYCILSKEAESILKSAILELGISARAYDKLLKISRTIADMDRSDIIQTHHISEAIEYRCLDRSFWQ